MNIVMYFAVHSIALGCAISANIFQTIIKACIQRTKVYHTVREKMDNSTGARTTLTILLQYTDLYFAVWPGKTKMVRFEKRGEKIMDNLSLPVDQAPVVQRLDNFIQWISHYPTVSICAKISVFPLVQTNMHTLITAKFGSVQKPWTMFNVMEVSFRP